MTEVSEKENKVELGEEVMDGEHAAQIRLLESFEEGLREGKDRDDLVIVLDRLVEFTNLHFMSEEMLMSQHGFSGLATHAQDHDSLRAQVGKMQESFNGGDQTMTANELVTLRKWLIDHIMTKDRAFVLYLGKAKKDEI
jgi:hemerythrin